MLLRKLGYVCSRAGGLRLSPASVRRCGLGGTELSERELRHHEVPSRVAPERLALGEAAQPMGSNWTRARSGSGRWPRACRRASGSGIGVGWIGKRVAASCCSRTRAITRGARDVWSGGKHPRRVENAFRFFGPDRDRIIALAGDVLEHRCQQGVPSGVRQGSRIAAGGGLHFVRELVEASR